MLEPWDTLGNLPRSLPLFCIVKHWSLGHVLADFLRQLAQDAVGAVQFAFCIWRSGTLVTTPFAILLHVGTMGHLGQSAQESSALLYRPWQVAKAILTSF